MILRGPVLVLSSVFGLVLLWFGTALFGPPRSWRYIGLGLVFLLPATLWSYRALARRPAVRAFVRRGRVALLAAFVLSSVPAVYYVLWIALYGFPQWSDDLLYTVTKAPGTFVYEGVLRRDVVTATTHLSYAGHAQEWLGFLLANLAAWVTLVCLVQLFGTWLWSVSSRGRRCAT